MAGPGDALIDFSVALEPGDRVFVTLRDGSRRAGTIAEDHELDLLVVDLDVIVGFDNGRVGLSPSAIVPLGYRDELWSP